MYVTLPYVYVEPIIEVGSCSLELDPILSYGGPGECNYDKDEKTCDSDKTIKDTMKDQGWPCMLACGACLTAPGYVHVAEAAQELPGRRKMATGMPHEVGEGCSCSNAFRGSLVALRLARAGHHTRSQPL